MTEGVCGKHGAKGRRYSQQYDTLYCTHCDRWLEFKCKMQGCVMCESRPRKPSLVPKQVTVETTSVSVS